MAPKQSKKRRRKQNIDKTPITSKRTSTEVKEPKRNKVWSADGMEIYVKILANTDDKERSWLFQLENYALKNCANEELFLKIREELEEALPGDPADYTFTIDQLRTKYKWFKKEWCNIDTKIKYGSGLGRKDTAMPAWYDVLNPHFCEAVEDMTSVSNKASNLQSFSSSSEDKGKSDDENNLDSLKVSIESNMENLSDGHEDDHINDGISSSSLKTSKETGKSDNLKESKKDQKKKSPKKTDIKFHPRRHAKPKSQSEAMLQVAKSIENCSANQEKNKDARLQALIESDKKRDEMFLAYQREQAECNRKHKLLLMIQLLMQLRLPITNMRSAHTFSQDMPLSAVVPTWNPHGAISNDDQTEHQVHHQL